MGLITEKQNVSGPEFGIVRTRRKLTFRGAVETDVELLHAIIDECHFIVRHQPEGRKHSVHRFQDAPKRMKESSAGRTSSSRLSLSGVWLHCICSKMIVSSDNSNLFQQVILIIVRRGELVLETKRRYNGG
jgi:hypothetical protein